MDRYSHIEKALFPKHRSLSLRGKKKSMGLEEEREDEKEREPLRPSVSLSWP